MPSSVALRPVASDDEAFLVAVYASTRAEELAVTGWTDEQKEQFCRMQFKGQDAHYRGNYPTAQFDVILKDDVPAGRLYVDRWEKEMRIMDIALLPEHRGHGIATELLRTLQEEAAAAGKRLSIHVERMNPALRLYERLNFKLVEDKGVYLLLDWDPARAEAV
jgi:ribosomal protein S18 acetylase RimI-like enzyme